MLEPGGIPPEKATPPGELVSLATSDADQVGASAFALASLAGAVSALVVSAVVLLGISVSMGLVVLLGLPPLLVLIRFAVRPLAKRAETEQAAVAGAAAVATDVIGGLRVIKGLGAELAAALRYRLASRESLTASLASARVEAAGAGSFMAVVALVGGRQAASGEISIGQFVTAVGLTQFLIGPFSRLAEVGAMFARARASAVRISTLLETPTAVSDVPQKDGPRNATAMTEPRGRIAFNDVTYGPVRNLTVNIEPGQFVGIAAGGEEAEALIPLLERSTDPDAGTICLDGAPLPSFVLDALHEAVLVAPHDPELFSGTLAENVHSDEKRREVALVAAGADEVAGALPDGTLTTLGEGGRSLSGGQRQRVALARAIASNATVLVLHDPTTAVDAVTEHGVAKRLREVRSGRTTILITTSPALLSVSERVLFSGTAPSPPKAHTALARRVERSVPGGCAGLSESANPPDARTSTLLPTASGSETRRTLLGLVRPHGRLFLLTAFVLLVAGVAGLAASALIGYIVDLVVESDPPSSITAPVTALAFAMVLVALLSAVGETLVATLGERVLAGLRERVMERALAVPLETVEAAGTGDLVARVSGDVNVVSEAVRDALPALAVSGLTVGLTVFGLAALDWRLALAGLCAVSVQALALRWYLPHSAPRYAAERITEGSRAQQLLDTVGGAKTVRAFRLRDQHSGLVEARSRASITASLRAAATAAWFFSRLNSAELVGLGAILTVGFFLVSADLVTVGAATAAALYFQRLFDPIETLLNLLDTAASATAALARLVGVANLALPAEPPSPPAPKDSSISVSNLNHSYLAGHEVLHSVSLEVRPGERVAVVGASGAGKTTLAKLIAGIHEASEGEILLGGVPLADLGPKNIRNHVALVTQEVHVFSGTLADDLRLARPDAADRDLLSALDAVDALGWAKSLPGGLETVVGDGGYRLTAAQAQQLALARIILRDSGIVILDEATAEAGSAGARVLERSAEAAISGRTAIIVAHRLTQAVSADRIIVLGQGRIVETGTHEQLADSKGHYAALWSAWNASRIEVRE
ncbi:MAG: ABC transporter transmembrane domain-containing protein [Rubrobacter sp.]